MIRSTVFVRLKLNPFFMPKLPPKVIPCLISIEDIITLTAPNDAVLLKTAVKKYGIGLRKRLGKYKVINTFTMSAKFVDLPPMYPFIQIDPEKGSKALKCPHINDGQWMRNADGFDKCNEHVPVIKGRTFNVIARKEISEYMILMIFLVMDQLQCKFFVYSADKHTPLNWNFDNAISSLLRKQTRKIAVSISLM